MKKLAFLILLLSVIWCIPISSFAQTTSVPDTVLTFVLSNEAPGYLIDKLIAAGYGNNNLYQVMQAIKPVSDGAIPEDFLTKLAACPDVSEIFMVTLSSIAPPGNNPIGISTDGTLRVVPIYGKDYYKHEGYGTSNGNHAGVGNELFTYAQSPNYYIDAGTGAASGGKTTNYRAIAIAWSTAAPTTFVLSNEAPGYLIDHLIEAGYGNSSMYEVLVALKPTSGGVISDEFLATLASCPAGSEIFTAGLFNFAGLNNPVCVNSDGTLSINAIFGRDYFGKEGYVTYTDNQQGVGNESFTFATSAQFYINAGVYSEVGTIFYYKAFAIAWSNSTTKAITVTANSGQSKIYGAADPVFTYTVSPALEPGGSFTGALSRVAGENPGTYAITLGTLSAGTNYAITFVSADFTITPAAVTPTTFVLSNEAPGKLIDRLITAGYGNSSLYEVLVALKPASGGVISDEFLDKLASCPAGSEIFTAVLSDVVPPVNNPIGINSDGTLLIVPIYGTDYFQHEGWETFNGNQSGVGNELFTYTTSPQYYVDAGPSQTPGVTTHYQVFAIAWSNSTDGISDAVTNPASPYIYPNPFTDGFSINNLPENTRLEIFDVHGKLLYQIEPKNNSLVKPGQLPDGVYFLKLTNIRGTRYQKIVKY
ncbi:MAG: MBG domain-containing protein [Bacteroidia bacterium]|nr:MBG domain-containing protein [Bacteroidia bacterium]